MKRLIIITTSIFLIIDVLCGWLISSYDWFNVNLSCTVIALTGLLLIALWLTKMRDAFKISLTALYSIACILATCLAVVMPQQFTDNWQFIAIICIAAGAILSFFACLITSLKTN